jgi:ABC-type maltose transport system permease subunit
VELVFAATAVFGAVPIGSCFLRPRYLVSGLTRGAMKG